MTTPASGLKASCAGGRPPVDAASPEGVSSPAASSASTRAPTVERASPVSLMSSARVRGVPSSMSWSSSPAPDVAPAEKEPTVVTRVVKHSGLPSVAAAQLSRRRSELLLDVPTKVALASRRMQGNGASTLLGMADIVKRFPGVVALGGVDLDVRPGEVHCLLGQNGAGKSTLIKVLAGVHQPDEGTITWDGQEVPFAHPQAAMDLGIATIYQELDLVEGLTVAENIYLGHERSRFGFSQRRATARSAAALLKRLGHTEISPSTEVGDLSAAGQQIVSMARALSHDAKLIIMDEPSAVLDAGEVERLFHVIRDLTAEGVAVVYISHRLEEIRTIGDRVTVLKDGRTVATGLPAKETPTSEVIRLMTGRAIEYVFPPRRKGPTGEPLLRVQNISRPGEFADVSFDVRPGEVVGLAGLVGAGRSEIIETVFGARRSDTGSVHVDGERLRPGSVQEAVDAGIGLCPEERKSQALFLGDSIATNIRMASLTRFSRGGMLDHEAERRAALEQAPNLDVRPPGVDREMPPSPAATSRRSSSPGGCCAGAACCCSTSPPEASTSAPAPRSTPSSAASPTTGSPSSSSPARSRRSSASPTASSSSARARSSTRQRPTSSTTPGARHHHERRRGMSLDSTTKAPEPEGGPSSSVAAAAGGHQQSTAPADPPKGSRASGLLAGSAGRNLGLVIALLILCAAGLWTAGDRFASVDNAMTILRFASVIGVVSVGMTFVIGGGGIDLSVGAIVALSSVWATTLATQAMAADTLILQFLAWCSPPSRWAPGAASSTGSSWPTAGSPRSSPRWRCSPPPVASPRSSPSGAPRSSRAATSSTSSAAASSASPCSSSSSRSSRLGGWVLLNRTTFGRRTLCRRRQP